MPVQIFFIASGWCRYFCITQTAVERHCSACFSVCRPHEQME